MNTVQQIYEIMEDELSRRIFLQRVKWSITQGDERVLSEFWEYNERLSPIKKVLENNNGNIVIAGCGYRGIQLKNIYRDLKWKCFIDNNYSEEFCKEIPVYKVSDFSKMHNNEIIVIASRLYEKEIYEQLCALGVSDKYIINYGKVLNQLLEDQYFDLTKPFLSNEQIFVDMGCWDGKTSVRLKKMIKDNLQKVIAFEPDKKRVAFCKKNMDSAGIGFKLIEKGCWSKESTLCFNSSGVDGMLMVDDSGNEFLEVTSLDRVIGDDKVSFIKMDIEGAEYEALKGCKKTIQKYQPILAISVYHCFDDIIRIPQLINNYDDGYKFYLRHYSPANAETILYAIPKQK